MKIEMKITKFDKVLPEHLFTSYKLKTLCYKSHNLLDFTITEDGKTLYLLNGLKIYKVEI